MNIYARQGDLIIKALPQQFGELDSAPETANPVLAGHDSAPHTIQGTVKLLQKRESGMEVTYLRISAPSSLIHSTRHLAVPMEPGDYAIHRLRERGDASDRAVED